MSRTVCLLFDWNNNFYVILCPDIFLTCYSNGNPWFSLSNPMALSLGGVTEAFIKRLHLLWCEVRWRRSGVRWGGMGQAFGGFHPVLRAALPKHVATLWLCCLSRGVRDALPRHVAPSTTGRTLPPSLTIYDCFLEKSRTSIWIHWDCCLPSHTQA